MPELPEVEALALDLKGRLDGHAIAKIHLAAFSALKTFDPPVQALEGTLVDDVSRHGKFLDIEASGLHLIFHLARAGWIRWKDELPTVPPRPNSKSGLAVRVVLDDQSGLDVTEAGTKKSLAAYVVRDAHDVPGIASLGPDPLTDDFTVEVLRAILQREGGKQLKGVLWPLYDRRGWYHATVEVIRDMLGVLAAIPDRPDHWQEELTLRTTLARALTLLRGYTGEAEDAYVEALTKRYSSDPNADLKQTQVAYKDAMAALARQYPGDLDAQTLYAESLMDLRPWQLWTRDGKPADVTGEVMRVLESVLKRNPLHPGANHYYIHTMEGSPEPEKALASARRLRTLVPAAGHLVHMPAHIYARTGQFVASANSNAAAAGMDAGGEPGRPLAQSTDRAARMCSASGQQNFLTTDSVLLGCRPALVSSCLRLEVLAKSTA